MSNYELQIGDLVKHGKEIVQIDSIGEPIEGKVHIIPAYGAVGVSQEVYAADLLAIPMNTQSLLKNGYSAYTIDKGFIVYNNGRIAIYKVNNEFIINVGTNETPVWSVNQWQHILRDSGFVNDANTFIV